MSSVTALFLFYNREPDFEARMGDQACHGVRAIKRVECNYVRLFCQNQMPFFSIFV